MSVTDEEVHRVVWTVMRLSRVLACSDSGLTMPQHRLLTMISRGDERSSRIATELAVSKPTVSALVEALVGAGHLTRTTDPDDRRVVRLTLTHDGHRALAHADAALVARLRPVVEGTRAPKRTVAVFDEVASALDDRRVGPPPERVAAGR